LTINQGLISKELLKPTIRAFNKSMLSRVLDNKAINLYQMKLENI